MDKRELAEGDILQINPEHKFGGMLLVVTEPKAWGAQGVLYSSREFKAVRFAGRAYLRVNFDEVEYCGRMEWMEYDRQSPEPNGEGGEGAEGNSESEGSDDE